MRRVGEEYEEAAKFDIGEEEKVSALSRPISRKRDCHSACMFAAQGDFGAFAKELAILDGESPELGEAVVVGDVGDA